MEPYRPSSEQREPDQAQEALPSYSTEKRPAPPAALSSLFPTSRSRRALFWGILSTVLSAIGLIGLALFEQYNGMLSELRTDLKHFNETSSAFVKKDKMLKCWERLKESSKEMHLSAVARERVEKELKASERIREDMLKEMQRLRERLAYLEGMSAARSSAGSSGDGADRDEETSRRPSDGGHPARERRP